MKFNSGVSVLVLAALLSATPAMAVSLNVGGDEPLLSVGGSDETAGSDGGVDVNVDLGGDGATSGGLDVDLDANVTTDGGADIEVDVDLDGDGDVDADDLLLKKKLVETGGDNLVTVDTTDDSEALVTLFGSGDDGGVDAAVDLVEDGGNEAEVSLFGSGGGDSDADVDVEILEGDAGNGLDAGGLVDGGEGLVGGIDTDDLLGDDIIIDLFGPGAGAGVDVGLGVDDTQTGSIGNDGANGSTGGAGGAPAGGNAAAGDVAGGSSGADSDGISGGGASPGAVVTPRPATRVAATGDVRMTGNSGCFTPDEEQIAHLIGRSSYDASVTASWSDAAEVDIVEIDLCPEARARLSAALAADPNLSFLHSAVATDARLVAALEPAHAPTDVLAVDKAGRQLKVFVY